MLLNAETKTFKRVGAHIYFFILKMKMYKEQSLVAIPVCMSYRKGKYRAKIKGISL